MSELPLNIETSTSSSLTLYDLQRMVRATLESRFIDPVWISAEISELKVNRSGHCYLNLVEKGISEATPRAEARAVIWRSSYARLAPLFESSTGAPLAAGIRVLVRVMVTYHEVYGFSLQIIDLDPSYTLGEVERRRMQTIAMLQADGVWDMNRETEWHSPTLRIAVVSSPTAAGYQDFIRELHRSPYRFRVTLFESIMQGDSAEQSVVDALMHIASREEQFDAVAILRGGGSTSDLALFDSYRIALCVAQFPLPIVTGIGHDKDVSVVDMVAHTSCKTPTAVATHFVEEVDQLVISLDGYTQQLRDIVVGRIAEGRMLLERYAGEVTRSAVVALNNQRHRLDSAEQIMAEGVCGLIQREQQRLDMAQTIVESRSVESILRLGFAVVRGKDGRVADIHKVECGESVEIELAEGMIGATVHDKQLKDR